MHVSKPKTNKVAIRLTNAELDLLETVMASYEASKSDAIRISLEFWYRNCKESPGCKNRKKN